MKPIVLLLSIILMSCSSPRVDFQVEKANPLLLKKNVKELIYDERYRNYNDIEELNRVADYIKNEMESFGVQCEYQIFSLHDLEGQEYKNVICKLDAGKDKSFVVGAHYDVCNEQEGADDNASGVSGLIETARILSKYRSKLTHNIEFVAFTLEEPPFFRTSWMGSYIHAQSISKSADQYDGMISIEMIGYFSEDEIQEYPAGVGLFYPKHGNFIAAVGNLSSKWIADSYQNKMNVLNELDVQKLAAPSLITGVDFSDHLNYWAIGLDAIMITDTAFMRNKNYHEKTDTIETLNFEKMGFVVNGITAMFLQ